MWQFIGLFILIAIALLTAPLADAQASSLPDFDRNGVVDFPDFLQFVGKFGARQGDEAYEDRFDLDGDGAIGFSDFLIFSNSFGKEVSSLNIDIPDADLRAVIEDNLGKARGVPITRSELSTLTRLEASNANIGDLTGLAFATHLVATIRVDQLGRTVSFLQQHLRRVFPVRIDKSNMVAYWPQQHLGCVSTIRIGQLGRTSTVQQ